MKKSAENLSSEKSSHENSDSKFSPKRYFINNLDSYHGGYILKEVAKILNKNDVESTKQSSQNVAEEAEKWVIPYQEEYYEIIGTVDDPNVTHLDNVTQIISKTECLPRMLTCGAVILDISCCDDKELKLVLEYLKIIKDLLEKLQTDKGDTNNEEVNAETKQRFLILISTVMTWAATKPLDPDVPDMPFVETDFRKRKPHPNYRMHYDIENEVIGIARNYKKQIGAIVVTVGVTYGGREDVLFYWFQKTWECERILPIIGRGGNAIPLLNVEDLARIVYNLLVDFPKKLYILAVDQNVAKQRQIVKPLGKMFGSGMFTCIQPEDAFLVTEIDQRTFDLMTINLYVEPTFIVETMGIQSDSTFADNVPVLMKQFKAERKLKPFKVIIYGPPIVGKTKLAKMICEAYGLLYVSTDTVVQDMIEDLRWRVNHWDIGEKANLRLSDGEENLDAPDSDEEEGDEENIQETTRQTLALLLSGQAFTEEEIIGYLRRTLLSREAQNRGWVLDGFPTNLPQCSTLFEKGDDQDSVSNEENEDEQFDEDADLFSNVLKKLLPDIVVSLNATDEFICEKAMRQSSSDSRFNEEVVLRRLSEFRSGDTPELTPLNFFDELDIHPLVISVKEHTDYDMKNAYSAVTLRMGRPCRYKKLLALIEAAEKKEKAEEDALKIKEAKRLEELEKKLKEEREDKMEYWSELHALIQEEEEAALAAAAEPMRNYLMKYIFPTLTSALLEVAKIRPDDPIDFLAEYLFKLNPSGKMLEPGYNLQAEMLLGKIKLLDEALKDLDIQMEPLIPPDLDVGETSKKHNMHSL